MSEEKDQRQQMPMPGMFQMPFVPPQAFGPPPMQQGQPFPVQPGFPPFMQQPVAQPVGPPSGEGMLPLEQSYVENILRLNRGRVATIYMTFENNERWNAKIFKGVIEAAGRDHIIISDPETEKRYLLLTIYLDYITFDERIDYEYPTAF
ncbi:spore coat protein GerQ [Amphibacillus xylanus]|uniref:Spore coat protein GerQ n=1 Tax=Amphibacillus xylanus (strain ATCC 51415 / DSM 6626 / JCM 7361 / LMG 17667 / NBRC 15112 / Ep01) TaxID=698758 RepID=K0J5H8_AMPXN|nr:spore coat protein GerQ [Amphibacillus xylanus]BAM48211.1 spore coat protein GerQ [Amphibacillus xylanus NBRC 15112]